MLFNRKSKKKIQSLEARIRRLVSENHTLQLDAIDARLQLKSALKSLEVYERTNALRRLQPRDSRGRFVKKQTI